MAWSIDYGKPMTLMARAENTAATGTSPSPTPLPARPGAPDCLVPCRPGTPHPAPQHDASPASPRPAHPIHIAPSKQHRQPTHSKRLSGFSTTAPGGDGHAFVASIYFFDCSFLLHTLPMFGAHRHPEDDTIHPLPSLHFSSISVTIDTRNLALTPSRNSQRRHS